MSCANSEQRQRQPFRKFSRRKRAAMAATKTDVREACIGWISLAIQETHPSEKQYHQLAEQLMETAERWHVPAEQLANWVRRCKEPPSPTAAEAWARAYDALRTEVRA